MTQDSPRLHDQACQTILDFSQETEIRKWRPVLDGVMGGKSTGNRFTEDQHMTFKGLINTNGGGFSSLRRTMTSGDLAGAKNLSLRLRQDGRSYKLTFRTDERHWGRLVSYQLPIPKTPKGDWGNVKIPLSGFRTSVFGRSVKSAPFDPTKVTEIGIIIADGIDGPFEINMRSISCS